MLQSTPDIAQHPLRTATYKDNKLLTSRVNLRTCYICNMGRSDLPGMYARARGRAAPEGECGHIRQITTAHVTCYICNMGRSDLPDMYARARGRAAPEGECGHIRQITTARVTYVM